MRGKIKTWAYNFAWRWGSKLRRGHGESTVEEIVIAAMGGLEKRCILTVEGTAAYCANKSETTRLVSPGISVICY